MLRGSSRLGCNCACNDVRFHDDLKCTAAISISREVLGAHKQLGAHSSLNGGARLGT
jgi:hypothetical protein